MFHQMTLDDLSWMAPILARDGALGNEYVPFNYYGWADLSEVAPLCGGFAARWRDDEGWLYVCPVGVSDERAAIEALRATARAAGELGFRMLCNAAQAARFPQGFAALRIPAADDYLYAPDDLINLPGAKYHKKRNHIAQFIRDYPDWRFEPLVGASLSGDWHKVLWQWGEHHEDVMRREQTLCEALLAHMDAFRGIGGVLYIGDRPVAFSLGTIVGERMLDVHIEKADAAYPGAYIMITREMVRFARAAAPFQYVNREDDLGLENLRKAKRSLHPARMEEKQILTALP